MFAYLLLRNIHTVVSFDLLQYFGKCQVKVGDKIATTISKKITFIYYRFRLTKIKLGKFTIFCNKGFL